MLQQMNFSLNFHETCYDILILSKMSVFLQPCFDQVNEVCLTLDEKPLTFLTYIQLE